VGLLTTRNFLVNIYFNYCECYVLHEMVYILEIMNGLMGPVVKRPHITG
jgi:hypothetical protein